jgi:SAM-dependent methyltransferase
MRAPPALRDTAHRVLDYAGYEREQWSRVVMRRESRRLIETLGPSGLSALEISGTFWSNLPFKQYESACYPEFDVCADALPRSFDLIIAEQVFEHLLWPYRAATHVFQMLAPGGYFLVSTPFLLRIHNEPIDCTRWTETGLRHLLAESGFPLTDIQTGSWGNRACVKSNFGWWARYNPWIHSLRNEPDFPVHVWALARKAP